ncbi:Vacuolar protein sorting-associated protein 53 [Savitreella phatthalungensis]
MERATQTPEPRPPAPLGSGDFDVVDALDALFDTDTAWELAPRVIGRIERHDLQLARELHALQLSGTKRRQERTAEIERLRQSAHDLAAKLEALRARAREVESRTTAMTGPIASLDTAKRNLTATITLVKRLQMLSTAIFQLQKLSRSKKYGEAASLLSAVIQLMSHFRSYRSVPQIATLSQSVADLQRQLLENVSSEFETCFSEGLSSSTTGLLSQACQLVDVLGDGPRERITTWYINAQLREYRGVFRASEEAASLDNISRRYAWLKRILKQFDLEHSKVFPESWRMLDQLVAAAAQGTKEDLADTLATHPPDIKIMLQALHETADFERWLADKTSDQRIPKLSDAFEPYLGVFVDQQDRTLAGMLQGYKTQKWPAMDEEVLPSSADLFYFYLNQLEACAQLSNGQPLADFARVMAKYLNIYCSQVLEAKYQSQVVTVEEIIMILRTADYCATTTQQLEERVKNTIASAFVERISFEPQAQSFQSTMSKSLSLLVQHLDRVVQLGLQEISKVNWQELDEVRDQSPYVAVVVAGLLREGKRVLHNLNRDKFVRAYCDRVVENFVTAFLNAVATKCRPVSEVTAEQLMLDIHAIKAALLNLAGSEASQNFTRLVNRQVGHVEVFLKLLLGSTQHIQGMIQNYLFLVGDRSVVNFSKLLDIKGVPRHLQSSMVGRFNEAVQQHDRDRLAAEEKQKELAQTQLENGQDAVRTSMSDEESATAIVRKNAAAQKQQPLQERCAWLAKVSLTGSSSNGVSTSSDSYDRKLDPSAFFRDQFGLGGATTSSHQRTGSASLPVTRHNTGIPQSSTQHPQLNINLPYQSPRTPQPDKGPLASPRSPAWQRSQPTNGGLSLDGVVRSPDLLRGGPASPGLFGLGAATPMLSGGGGLVSPTVGIGGSYFPATSAVQPRDKDTDNSGRLARASAEIANRFNLGLGLGIPNTNNDNPPSATIAPHQEKLRAFGQNAATSLGKLFGNRPASGQHPS